MEFGQICLNKKDRLAVIILAALLAHALDTLQKSCQDKGPCQDPLQCYIHVGDLSTIHEEVGCLPVSIPGI